jgi:hypothetical protein
MTKDGVLDIDEHKVSADSELVSQWMSHFSRILIPSTQSHEMILFKAVPLNVSVVQCVSHTGLLKETEATMKRD